MRINYSDDEQFMNQFELWQSNCERSLRGARGQIALLELEDALVAMKNRRLISGVLADDAGDVCALGSLALAVRTRSGERREAVIRDLARYRDVDLEDDREFVINIGRKYDVPWMMAWKLVEMNDCEFERLTPEGRYSAMLDWVRGKLKERER